MAKDKEKIIIKVNRELATNDSTIGKMEIALPDGKTFKALTLERKTRTFVDVANPRLSTCILANKSKANEDGCSEEQAPRKLKTTFIGGNPFCLVLSNKFYPLFCPPRRFDDVSVSQICIGSELINNYEMGGTNEAYLALEKLAKKWSLEDYEFYIDISEEDIAYEDVSYNSAMFEEMMNGEFGEDDDENFNFIKD